MLFLCNIIKIKIKVYLKKKKATSSELLKKIVVEAILDTKAEEVLELDLRNITDSVADFFVICHGNNTTQVASISDAVYKTVKEEIGQIPQGQEGKTNAQWVILDYFDVVVHIFYKETRQYYQLEELWSDAITIEHETV